MLTTNPQLKYTRSKQNMKQDTFLPIDTVLVQVQCNLLHYFVLFWDTLILSPRLRAMP